MQYRTLGRTGLKVSEIGLGTEYLNGVPRDTVVAVIHQAMDRGVNYFDTVFAFPEYRDNLAAALQGRRDQIVLPAHLGSGEKNGQYWRTHQAQHCERFFHDQLVRFETDYVDVLLLHNVNTVPEFERLLAPKGVMELAHRLQRAGQARFIGLSGHNVPMATRAIESGLLDVLMFPVNLAANNPAVRELLALCASRGVGVVAMKPFAGGKLFQRATVYMARYQTGTQSSKMKMPAATPAQCLGYVLAQPGIATVIPGVKNAAELTAMLAYLTATDEERDFAGVLAGLQGQAAGECVYCNHCLPCPVALDIGQVNRLADLAAVELTAGLRAEYAALAVTAAACTECGACVARCPFGVDVLARLRRAVALFG